MSRLSDPETFPEIPGFRIEAVLGRGSMATVYRANQLAMDRPVALKVLREGVTEDERTVRRLMREAQLAARLNHPHIVRAHDAGITGSLCWFVMELVEGASVRELVERRGPMDEDRALQVTIEIAEALAHFQREQVVHRDVKPANIMIDAEGKALLADLGLAKPELDPTMTSKDRSVGTPAYMSPEQARDPEHVDIRSDVFSLGATLYYMLSGVSPFDAKAVGQVLTKILYEVPTPIREVVPEVSEPLAGVLAKMLEKDRGARYAGAPELLRDLRAVQAGRLPPSHRGERRDRRRRRMNLALAIVSACALFAFLWWLAPTSGGDGAPNDDPRQDLAPPPQALSEPLLLRRSEESASDELRQELEQRFDGLVGVMIDRAAVSLESGRLSEAREVYEKSLHEAVAKRFERAPHELPGWMRERLADVRRTGLDAIAERETADRAKALADIVAVYEAVAAELQNADEFLPEAQVVERMVAATRDRIEKHPELKDSHLDAERKVVTQRLVFAWQESINDALTEAHGLIEAGRLASARAALSALKNRKPEAVDAGAPARIAKVETSLAEEHSAIEVRLQRALAEVDVSVAPGREPLHRASLADHAARMGALLATLPSDDAELVAIESTVASFRAFTAALLEAAGWAEGLRQSMADAALGLELRSLQLTSGRQVGPARLAAASSESWELAFADRPGTETVSWVELAPQSLDGLISKPGPAALVLIHLADHRLLEAEDLLGEVDDDRLRGQLAAKIGSAFETLNEVTNKDDKEAFTLWRQALTARREGDPDRALTTLRGLLNARALRESAWYSKNAPLIRRTHEELKRRERLQSIVAGRAGSFKFPTTSPDEAPRILVAYDFDVESQSGDFVMPPGSHVADGSFRRSLAEPRPRVRPDEVDPLQLDLPIDLAAGPFDLELEFVTSARDEELPRCLTISCFGWHVAFLGRLIRNGGYRHLPLHGLERAVPEMLRFDRVAVWSGDLSGVEDAFLPLEKQPEFQLESGKRYRIRIGIDSARGTLTLAVDGKVILTREGLRIQSLNRHLALREAMPHRLESLQFSGALRDD